MYYIYIVHCAEDLATWHDGYPIFYMLHANNSPQRNVTSFQGLLRYPESMSINNDPYKGNYNYTQSMETR